MTKQQAETFAMGRFGTVIPCSTTSPLSDELVMLGRLIGTTDPRGRAEARGIVERTLREMDGNAVLDGFHREHGCTPSMMASDRDIWRKRAEAAEAALRGVLPYAESRLEDMEDSQEDLDNGNEPSTPETREESRDCLLKAREAFRVAKGALAKSEGRA